MAQRAKALRLSENLAETPIVEGEGWVMVRQIGVLLMISISCNDPDLRTAEFSSGDNKGSNIEESDAENRGVVSSTAIGAVVVHNSKQYIQAETNSKRPLDILLVVDVSQSMAPIRDGLGGRLNVLLEQIKENDWRLAITTTNNYDCLPEKWILLKTPQGKFMRNNTEFNKIISGGTDSCGEICKVCSNCPEWSEEWIWSGLRHIERPIIMAINGLGGNIPTQLPMNNAVGDCQADGTDCDYPEIPEEYRGKLLCSGRRSLTKLNNDWLREESMIAVIIVTDEDNGEFAKDENGVTQPRIDNNAEDLTRYLEKNLNRKRGTSYEIYGILNPKANDSYQKIITDDNIQDVTDNKYDTVLNKISGGIRTVLNKTLDISDIAGKTNFKFKGIEGKEKDVHYTYKDNTITFIDGHVPAKNEKIIVNYSYTSN